MKHPAKYSDIFIEIFFNYLKNSKNVFDPFAGTGKIALIKDFGYKGKIICNEMEPEFINTEYPVDKWYHEDAEFISMDNIDAICTSPTYGNRMADHHNAKDGRKRITYTDCLGKQLKEGNTGKMQYGDQYKQKHINIYKNLLNILNKNGIFILNISNHIRKGIEIDVVSFHKKTMEEIGFLLQEEIQLETKRMRYGKNSELRVKYESILIFKKIN
jgi:tRNA G10  N-methylase Trm11